MISQIKKEAVSRMIREAAVLYLLFVTFQISDKRP
jgi:hypothetical protein